MSVKVEISKTYYDIGIFFKIKKNRLITINTEMELTKKEIPKNKYAVIQKITITLFILMGVVILSDILHRPSFLFELWIIGLFLFFGGIDYILIYKGYLNIWWPRPLKLLKLNDDVTKRFMLPGGILCILAGLFFLFLAVISTLDSLSII